MLSLDLGLPLPFGPFFLIARRLDGMVCKRVFSFRWSVILDLPAQLRYLVWYGTSTEAEDSVLLAELVVNEIAVLATGVYTQYINIW